MEHILIDALLGSIIPLINFIGIMFILVHMQYLRRQIKSAQDILDHRATVFNNIFKEIERLREHVDKCPLLEERPKLE